MLLLVCITLAILVLAAPAAGKGRAAQRVFRPPADATIMWGPLWFEYSGATGTLADFSWYMGDPEASGWVNGAGEPFPYKAVSVGDDFYYFSMWGGVNYGYLWNVPKYLPHTVEVTDPAGVVTTYGPAETSKYWSGPYVRDTFWTDWWYYLFGYDLWAFNPAIAGGRMYFNSLYFPIELTQTGTYGFKVTWTSTMPLNEMIYVGLDPSKPTHTAPGEQGYEYTFSVLVE
jgi:hypothetical protein